MRITRGNAPGTGISRAHSSGTWLSPIRRAATAGNSASRSSVQVKMQLTRSSGASLLRSSTALTNSSVASTMAVASFSSTVVAPLRARSLTASHSDGAARRAACAAQVQIAQGRLVPAPQWRIRAGKPNPGRRSRMATVDENNGFDAHAVAVVEHTIELDLSLDEANALRAWLLKPAADGSTALDDSRVNASLKK